MTNGVLRLCAQQEAATLIAGLSSPSGRWFLAPECLQAAVDALKGTCPELEAHHSRLPGWHTT